MALNAQHAYWYIGLSYRTMNKEFGPIYAVERGDKKQCVRGEKSYGKGITLGKHSGYIH